MHIIRDRDNFNSIIGWCNDANVEIILNSLNEPVKTTNDVILRREKELDALIRKVSDLEGEKQFINYEEYPTHLREQVRSLAKSKYQQIQNRVDKVKDHIRCIEAKIQREISVQNRKRYYAEEIPHMEVE